MSLSNAPNESTLGRVAGALAVDEAFVEKDWYVIQAIRCLAAAATDDLMPVFSGGTSLLKGYGLVRRFSEDIDFKLALSPAFVGKSPGQRKRALGAYKRSLETACSEAGFEVTDVFAGSGNAFIRIDMDYPTTLEPHPSLRPHIQVELSAKPPELPTIDRPLISFVAEYFGSEPELASMPCVDPVETAADKLSAFCWRMLTRDRSSDDDDPTIIRHLHDLAALEEPARVSVRFGSLLGETLLADAGRGGGALAGIGPRDRLAAMQARLKTDEIYADEYARFVGGLAFAGEPEIPTFDEAVAAVVRLSRLLPE
jgi:hypothetical protein